MKPVPDQITVIGAGGSGLATAGHLALTGHRVRLWNRSEDAIARIAKSGTLSCTGAIEGEARLELATTDMERAAVGSRLMMVTTPASAHVEIARSMAPFVTPETIVLLNPGRTFGAIEFAHALRQAGVSRLPEIAEAQTIIYTCRKTAPDQVSILTLKHQVLLAALTGGSDASRRMLMLLPECLRNHFAAADGMVQTSIGNVGMILHCLPTLLNIGWIESPRAEFKYYYDGITPSVAMLAERLDEERLGVARVLGRELESTAQWLRRSYRVAGRNLFECIQGNAHYRTIDAPTDVRHRYLFEDVPCGLVPLEAVGKLMGLSMPMTSLAVDLACSVLVTDFRACGRSLARLGLDAASADEVMGVLAAGRSFP